MEKKTYISTKGLASSSRDKSCMTTAFARCPLVYWSSKSAVIAFVQPWQVSLVSNGGWTSWYLMIIWPCPVASKP